jgi:TPR repeat/Bacterial pre-peptidase C-terminal domain
MKLVTFSQKIGLLAIATTLLSGLPLLSAPVQAQTRTVQAQTRTAPPQTLLEQRGTLQPLQHDYTFSGKKGQTVTVAMTSKTFDPVLSLLDPSGHEIATNDDFARTLNSTIVITLPSTGTYKVVARSVSGQGGDYTLVVKPATAYEQAYAHGMEFYTGGKSAEAITAYTEAIRLDPNQPVVYLDRGDAYYAQGNLQALIADYQKAADLYEKTGDRTTAQTVREQIQSVENAPDQQSGVFSYPEPSF